LAEDRFSRPPAALSNAAPLVLCKGSPKPPQGCSGQGEPNVEGEEILGRPSGYSGPFAGGTVSFSSATVAGAGGVGLQDNLLDLTRLPRASGDLNGRPEEISDRARQQASRVTRAGLAGRPVPIIRGPGSHLVTPIVR